MLETDLDILKKSPKDRFHATLVRCIITVPQRAIVVVEVFASSSGNPGNKRYMWQFSVPDPRLISSILEARDPYFQPWICFFVTRVDLGCMCVDVSP